MTSYLSVLHLEIQDSSVARCVNIRRSFPDLENDRHLDFLKECRGSELSLQSCKNEYNQRETIKLSMEEKQKIQ